MQPSLQLPLETPSSKYPVEANTNRDSIITVPFDENGFALGWRFAVKREMMACIGMRHAQFIVKSVRHWACPIAKRVNENHLLSVYALTGQPDIREGYTFYDTPLAYLPLEQGGWSKSLKHIKLAATIKTEDGSDNVSVELSKPNAEKTKLQLVAVHSTKKHLIIFFLQTGMLITSEGNEVALIDTKNLFSAESPLISIKMSAVEPPSKFKKWSGEEIKAYLANCGITTQAEKKEHLLEIAINQTTIDQYNTFSGDNSE